MKQRPLSPFVALTITILALLSGASSAQTSLNIGGILTIEGSLPLVNGGSQETGAAEGLKVFIGEGQAILPNGNVNPLARGILLTNATVGVVKIGSDYAVLATGTGEAIGVADLILTGTITARVNMLSNAVDEIIPIPGTSNSVHVMFTASEVAASASEPYYEIVGAGASIDVLGKTISADLNIRKLSINRNGSMEGALNLGMTSASTSFGSGTTDIVTMSGATGDFLVMSDGTAASLNGNFAVSVASTIGAHSLEINTTSTAVTQNFVQDGAAHNLNVAAGPFVRIYGPQTTFSIPSQSMGGDFEYYQDSSGDVVVQATDLVSVFGDGSTDLLTLNGGNGILLLTTTGVAADIQGSLASNDAEISASSLFHLQINDTAQAINRTITLNGSSQDLILAPGPFVRFVGVDAQLTVLGSSLTGNFAFEKTGGGDVQGQISNGTLALNDGSTDLLVVSNGSGILFMDSTGTAMEFSGDISLNVAGVSTGGSFSVSANTGTLPVSETLNIDGSSQTLSLPPGPFLKVSGVSASLLINGVQMTGNLDFERESNGTVKVCVTDGGFIQGGGLVTLINGTGCLILFSDGIAGELGGSTIFAIPGLTPASSFVLQINTTAQLIDTVITIDGSPTNVFLEAGPYLRMLGIDAVVDITGQSMSGNLAFEQTTPQTVKLTASDIVFDMGPGALTVFDVAGVLQIDSTGVVGALAVQNALFNAPNVSLSGLPNHAAISTRPQEFTGDFDLGNGPESITFPPGPYVRVPFTGANLTLNRLLIGGTPASFSGDVSVTSAGGQTRLSIENADVFGTGTTLAPGAGTGDLLLTEGPLESTLPALAIDYGLTLDEPLTITGGVFEVGATIALRIHPGSLKTGDVPLIDFSQTTSSVTAGDFQVSPPLPTGFSLTVNAGVLLLSSALKPDSDDDGLSDAWESAHGPDSTSLSPNDNSDGDSLSALAEFALGLDPTVNDSPVMLASFITIGGQKYFSLSYPRNADALGLVGIFTERSIDLGIGDTWSVDDTIYQSSTATEVTDRSTVPFASGSDEFLRLTILRP